MAKRKNMMDMTPVCERCGKIAPVDEKLSTPNWTVYRTKEPCECGGKYTARALRLIDADAVYNKAMENHRKGEIEDWEFDSIINYLDGAPTINTVEIVYCKDCKHKVRTDANGIVICSEEHGMYCPTENDFCRYGVKKGETPE